MIDGFIGKTILILGDPVADQFLGGRISRVSREAPVFILKHESTMTVPGAAANAAANVASLGGKAILIGAIGNDVNGTVLRERLDAAGVVTDRLVTVEGMTTTTKVRVLAAQNYAPRQQILRIDYEGESPLPADAAATLVENLRTVISAADAIVVSDYGCGSVSRDAFEMAKSMASEHAIPVIVDSRRRLSQFTGATSATPNREEVEAVLGPDFNDRDCTELCDRLGMRALLVTNGNQGMTLFEKGTEPQHIEAVGSKEPVDVTGAGDTVIATYALGLASGLDFVQSAKVANHAGGLVVMKKGTASVSAEELAGSLNRIASSLAAK
ncbi:MAG: sugar kinase [Chloracidobacterium sp.]|nr:sugar kinase [Chloracidobacterium sp.]